MGVPIVPMVSITETAPRGPFGTVDSPTAEIWNQLIESYSVMSSNLIFAVRQSHWSGLLLSLVEMRHLSEMKIEDYRYTNQKSSSRI